MRRLIRGELCDAAKIQAIVPAGEGALDPAPPFKFAKPLRDAMCLSVPPGSGRHLLIHGGPMPSASGRTTVSSGLALQVHQVCLAPRPERGFGALRSIASPNLDCGRRQRPHGNPDRPLTKEGLQTKEGPQRGPIPRPRSARAG